jgi:hypothetical protein
MRLFIFLFVFLFISSQSFSQLKNSLNQSDYIVITVEQFEHAFDQLREIRESEGFKVYTILLKDIESEFPSVKSSESIRDFISYALTNWHDPKPKYILLAGDIEFIPSIRIASIFPTLVDSVSVDSYYAINKYENDIIPDIAIGRIPINNINEANIVTEKIKLFERNKNVYPQDLVLLADWSKNEGAVFNNMADNLIEDFNGSNWKINKHSAFEDTVFVNVKDKFINALNVGTMFVNYLGHGSYYQWSNGNLFDIYDIENLTNENFPFITTSISCDYLFDQQNDSTIAEGLIFGKDKGAVASIGSSGLNYASSGYGFISEFYKQIRTNNFGRIGDHLLNVQQKLTDEYSKRFTLLGDPAMTIQTKLIAGNVDIKIPDSFVLHQNYPNPFNPKSIIKYEISKTGYVTLGVYDILGKEITTLVNEIKSPGYYEVIFNGANLSSGTYFYRLQTGEFFSSKKMSLIK